LSTELPVEKQLRADARRNRARVLEAADAVFAAEGARAGIEEIAERAGVGVGTVCRNFPTKEDLIAEVLAARCEELLGEMREAAADPDAGAAFVRFMTTMADFSGRYKALAEELAARGELPVRPGLKEQLHEATDRMVRRAQEAKALRTDVTTADLKLVISGIAQATVIPGVDASRQRFLRIVLDGLRPESAADHP
jgi:AcrR family transcriptional regulator